MRKLDVEDTGENRSTVMGNLGGSRLGAFGARVSTEMTASKAGGVPFDCSSLSLREAGENPPDRKTRRGRGGEQAGVNVVIGFMMEQKGDMFGCS